VSFARSAAASLGAVVLCSLLQWPADAVAQETTGAVLGTVRSDDGLALPGATATISNPATGLEIVATTGDRGEFRFLALPPATYVVEVALDGFRMHRQTLPLSLGQTITYSVEMILGSYADAIEVTAERGPVVDVTSTVIGMTVDVSDLNDRVPVQREVTQVALLAPGTTAGDTAFDDRTPGQRLASFSGASVAENLYVLNGLNITNFREMLGSTKVPLGFLDEVQVKTGGYEAEFGRSTGGVINMVTRSGGNTLRGAASVYYLPGDLQGTGPDTAFASKERDYLQYLEADLSVGGAVVEDRLFYFLFADYEDTERVSHYATPNYYLPLFDRTEYSRPSWGGKVDWTPSPRHRIEATYISDRVDADYTRWDYGVGEPLGSGVNERGGANYILRYSGALGERALLSLQGGRNEFARTNRSDGDDCPVAVDRRSGQVVVIGCWVNLTLGTAKDVRQAYRADLDVVVGGHSLRAGLDYEQNVSEDDTSYSGRIGYQYYLNGARFPQLPASTELVLVGQFHQGGSFDVLSSAAYVQDSWTVSPRLTLNVGLRWERYDNRNGLGETFIETDDQVAPRLGMVWDPAGDGRSKVHASYGRYHLPIASNTNVRVAGAVFRANEWYVLQGGINPDGSPGGLGEQLSSVVLANGETPDPRELIADDFEPMSQDEVILGYERMLGDAWSVGARGIARRFNQVIEDYTIDQGLEAVYGVEPASPVFRIGNPGSSFDGWYDLDGDGVLDSIHLPADTLGYPEAERTYYALELTFNRRFADNWTVQGSYVWGHLYGNYEGYTNSDIGQSDPGITQTFDFPALLEHGNGDLPNDRRHTVKAFGSYAWPLGVQLGGNFFYQTGRPINSFGLHPTDEDARSYGANSFYTNGEPRPRGCCGRTDDVWSLDVMARYDVRLAGLDLDFRIDVFNVFDNHAVTEVQERAEDATGAPDPTYGEAITHQTPRRVRFGVGVRF